MYFSIILSFFLINSDFSMILVNISTFKYAQTSQKESLLEGNTLKSEAPNETRDHFSYNNRTPRK